MNKNNDKIYLLPKSQEKEKNVQILKNKKINEMKNIKIQKE